MKKFVTFLLAFLMLPAVALAWGGHYGNHKDSTNDTHQNNHSHHSGDGSDTPDPGTPPSGGTNSGTPAPTTPVGSEISLNVYETSYQSGDNDPAGSDTTFINGADGHAGGTGTYTNPVTIAVGFVGSKADYPAGTMFYFPNIQRYGVVGDTCADCHSVKNGAQVHLDIYSGDYESSAGLACEDAITGNFTVIENPRTTYKVASGTIFNGASCQATFGNTLVLQ